MKAVGKRRMTPQLGLLLLLVAPCLATSETLKDPMERDEDISKMKIDVDFRQKGSGLWVYEYSLTSPEENKGELGSFSIDLTCSVDFEDADIVPKPVSDSKLGDAPANEEPITPVAIRAEKGAAYDHNIGIRGQAYWLLDLDPGESKGKLKLVSVAKPGLRQYELEPYLDTEGYDYSEPVPPSAPWTEDFTVRGVIPAPGCPGEVPPVEEPSFPGNTPGSETEDTNQLLTYKEPLKNRLHLDEGESAKITIVYGQELDPKTFKVQPGWAKQHFSPEPGTEETVEIPMKKDRLRLFLEGHRTKAEEPPRGKDGAPPEHARKDRDEFEFRLPGDGPGKAKGADKGKANGL